MTDNKMRFYHVVTERPMYEGQKIVFDENHHSGVYERVYAKKDIVDEIYRHPEKYISSVLEHHTMVALRELALEEVRLAGFPVYPSRMSSLYVSETLEEAERWFDFFTEIGRPTFQIVKVETGGRVFAGNANYCFDATADKSNNLLLAEKYWLNPPSDDVVKEILIDGEITITEIIKSI